MTGRVLIGGHRGCGRTDATGGRRDVPQENSRQAVELAFELGADFVEVDLCLDADGAGWLVHSSRLSEHVSNSPAEFLDQLTTQDVACLRGFGGQGLMPLADLLRDFSHCRVNVELKFRQGSGRDSGNELDRLDLDQWPERWWLSSFDWALLDQAHRRWPSAPKGLLFDEDWAGALDWHRARPSFWLHPEASLLPTVEAWPSAPVVAWSLAVDAGSVDRRCHGWITDRLERCVVTPRR